MINIDTNSFILNKNVNQNTIEYKFTLTVNVNIQCVIFYQIKMSYKRDNELSVNIRTNEGVEISMYIYLT